MDVSQEKHVKLYIDQHIYKHNLVDENYNVCEGLSHYQYFQNIVRKYLLESDFLASCSGIPLLNYYISGKLPESNGVSHYNYS